MFMRAMVRTFTLHLMVVIASTAYAAEHDTVVLKNGDRLLGSVSSLSRGELSFSIDGAGSVDINWSNIESVETITPLDVELSSGAKLRGTLHSPAPGKLEVKTDTTPQVVEMNEVVRITSIAANFADRTSGSIDVGFDFLQANTEFDLTLNAEAENRTTNYLTEASYETILRHLNGENAQWRNNFELGSRRFLPHRWFVLGRFQLEQDQLLDLDLRTLVYGAVGRYLIQSNRSLLGVHGGIDYDRENYGGLPIDNSPEALGNVEWDWFDIGGKTEFESKATTYITLNRSRLRFEASGQLRHDLTKHYYGALEVFESFDTDSHRGKNNDVGVSIAIGRSF